MSKNLIFYNPKAVAEQTKGLDLPGIKRFIKHFNFYNNSNSALVDRSGTLRLPIKIKCLFPLPDLKPFKKSLEEICNDRARELLKEADRLDVPLYVMWSGGIDSTLTLVSLFKNADSNQLKRIIVLMTEASINENRNFYLDHVRGRVGTESADTLPLLLGQKNMIVGGEGNDQVFGASVLYRRIIHEFGPEFLTKPYDRNFFTTLYARKIDDPGLIASFLDMCEKLQRHAPLQVHTNADFLWWEKFCMKWQCVYARKLTCASSRTSKKMNSSWVESMYKQFFVAEPFELWSMNNLDKRIRDTWKSYKWPCKDIIYDYTKDAEYRDNKTKRGSLRVVFVQRHLYNFIDESFNLHYNLDPHEYYEPDNDFR